MVVVVIIVVVLLPAVRVRATGTATAVATAAIAAMAISAFAQGVFKIAPAPRLHSSTHSSPVRCSEISWSETVVYLTCLDGTSGKELTSVSTLEDDNICC